MTMNSGMASMTWKADYVDANSGTIVDGTWYAVTTTNGSTPGTYTGAGRLFSIGIWQYITFDTAELRITTDGNTTTMTKAELSANDAAMHMASGGAARPAMFPFSLEFTTSLLVEVRRDGDTNDIEVFTSYGVV